MICVGGARSTDVEVDRKSRYAVNYEAWQGVWRIEEEGGRDCDPGVSVGWTVSFILSVSRRGGVVMAISFCGGR